MSDRSYVLYAHSFTSRAERVMWCLDELGLDYEVRRVSPRDPDDPVMREMRSLCPGARVPVLHDGEHAMSESTAILEVLAARYPDAGLMPAPDETYAHRRLVSYVQSEIEAYLWLSDQSTRLQRFYGWPDGTDERARAILDGRLPALFEMMGEPFALGARFTIADIYLGHVLLWASTKTELPEPVRVYLKRLVTRPAIPDGLSRRRG